jgi:hypothetical protein
VSHHVEIIEISFDFDALEIMDGLSLEVNVEIGMPCEVYWDLNHRGLVNVSLPYYP